MSATRLDPTTATSVVPWMRRVKGPVLTAVAGSAAMVALHFHDPHQSGSWGFCPFLAMTGQPCPLCGGLRAMNDVTRGRVEAALLSNAAAVFILCAGTVLIVRWFARRVRGDSEAVLLATPKVPTAIFAAVMIVFTVYRWTPWGQWLYQD